LVLASFGLGAGQAAAQAWNSTGVCVDASEVPGLFDPNAFVGLDKCAKLCRASADFCRKFVKAAVSCDVVSFKGVYGFLDKTECDTETDPVLRKQCKSNVKDALGGIKGEAGSFRDDQLLACEDFFDACVSDCMAPI
jgi:hypothetical protein